MKRIQLEFVSEGFHDLLCSDAIAGEVESAANKIADMATASAAVPNRSSERAMYVVKGPKMGGYGGGRVIAYVAADNGVASWDAIKHRRLETTIWEAQA